MFSLRLSAVAGHRFTFNYRRRTPTLEGGKFLRRFPPGSGFSDGVFEPAEPTALTNLYRRQPPKLESGKLAGFFPPGSRFPDGVFEPAEPTALTNLYRRQPPKLEDEKFAGYFPPGRRLSAGLFAPAEKAALMEKWKAANNHRADTPGCRRKTSDPERMRLAVSVFVSGLHFPEAAGGMVFMVRWRCLKKAW